MSDQQSLSGVFLGLGGGVVTSLGVASAAVGTLFAVNKLSGLGINGLLSLPSWLGMAGKATAQADEDQKPAEQETTKQVVGREASTYVKIGGVIVFGVLLRYAGTKMSSPEASTAFNNLLTGNFK